MWRQRPEEASYPGHAPAPDPVQPVVNRQAESPLPLRSQAGGENPSVLTCGIIVRGEISGGEGLLVDGTVEGTICLPGQSVTVGRNGRVVAPQAMGSAPCIRAQEIVLVGTVAGNIEAEDRVEIRAQASLTGDVSTRRISIEDGAYFRGGIDIRREQAAGPVAARESAPEAVHA